MERLLTPKEVKRQLTSYLTVKGESISSKVRNKIRMPTLCTFI